MKYLYRSHMGGFYTTDEKQPNEELFCETCGDWDEYYGEAATKADLWAMMVPELSVFGSGGVSLNSAYQALTSRYPIAVSCGEPTDLDILAQIACVLAEEDNDSVSKE